jgi:hypothetical protein
MPLADQVRNLDLHNSRVAETGIARAVRKIAKNGELSIRGAGHEEFPVRLHGEPACKVGGAACRRLPYAKPPLESGIQRAVRLEAEETHALRRRLEIGRHDDGPVRLHGDL